MKIKLILETITEVKLKLFFKLITDSVVKLDRNGHCLLWTCTLSELVINCKKIVYAPCYMYMCVVADVSGFIQSAWNNTFPSSFLI